MAVPTTALPSPTSGSASVDLNTLVAAIQNAVQAQNLIATNIKTITTAVTSQTVNTAALVNAVLSQTTTLNTAIGATTTAVNSQTTALTALLNAAFPTPISASASWTPGGIATGASATISFAATGVTLGQFVKASLAESVLGCDLTGYVAAANVVAAVINNNTGATVTFAATTVSVSVASS